jgi:hypothetical protein
MNNTVYVPVVWFVTGVFYIMLNQSISYLKLTPSTMSQIQKLVTNTKIVIITLMMMMMTIIIIIICTSQLENKILRVNWD